MIMDELTEFADATALSTAGTGLAVVGTSIDLGITDADPAIAEQLWLVLQITTAVASGGSATVSFQVCSDAQAVLAADASETMHIATAAFPKATLVAGFEILIPLPSGMGVNYERYLGLQQNVGTAALTAGAVNAFLTRDPRRWKAFAEGNN